MVYKVRLFIIPSSFSQGWCNCRCRYQSYKWAFCGW